VAVAFWAAIVLAVVGAAAAVGGTVWLQKNLVRPWTAARQRLTSQLSRGARLRQAVFVFVTLATLIGAVLGSINMPRYASLARHGRVTVATVVATDCPNHATFLYRFTSEDRSHSGRGNASSVRVPCEHLRPGDQVPVSYLPWDPNTSTVGDVHHHLVNEAVSVVLSATLFPLVIVGVLRSQGLI
jgi:Protein of unknown function (DUF3592)